MSAAIDAKRLFPPFFDPSARVIECPNCGLIQSGADCVSHEAILCCRCRTTLAHRVGKSLDATLASSATVLLLLLPATLEPFLTTSALGATRTSILPMSASSLWIAGWPALATVVFLFVLVFPVLRFGALTAVLAAIRLGKRPGWLGAAFRLSNRLQTWAMLDVYLLGLGVAYARLRASILVELDDGAMCFIAAALLSLIARATLDKARVWQYIAHDRAPPRESPAITCVSCDQLLPLDFAERHCPRCTAIVRPRRLEAISRPMALLVAAIVLYIPANVYPIATIPIELKPTAYTVLGGVVDLAKSRLLGLAILVFTASFAIPVLKMIGLSWCIVSALRGSTRRLIAKTRVYRLIEEIGRWSMVDPLTISCFVPVLHYSGLIDGRAEPAATPFAAVAILTTLAVKSFDPRLMWDAAARAA